MNLTAVDEARAEVRRLGAALTQVELQAAAGAPVPVELLQQLAAASRRMIDAIGHCIVTNELAREQVGTILARRRHIA